MSTDLVSSLLARPHLVDVPAVLLLGGPYVMLNGDRMEIPDGSKRLLVFVALGAGRVDRRYASGSLWPVGNDERAAGNLRSALWRLKGAGIDLLESDKSSLMLRPGTVVDVTILCEWAGRVVDGSATHADLSVVNWRNDVMHLLPGWYDDWVIFERERIRQRLLHALEVLSRRLAAAGRCAEAVEAAISAVSADPLRESANKVLIEAHLAEGNLVEGRRAYQRYRDTVRRELGIEPGKQLASLVRLDLGSNPHRYRDGDATSTNWLLPARFRRSPGPGLPALPLRSAARCGAGQGEAAGRGGRPGGAQDAG
jgi:DNA-binding SARP family transcriptional activator